MPCSRSPGGGIPACLEVSPKGEVEGSGLRGSANRGGACPREWSAPRGVWRPTPMMATAADSTHPTGMHSCSFHFFPTLHL